MQDKIPTYSNRFKTPTQQTETTKTSTTSDTPKTITTGFIFPNKSLFSHELKGEMHPFDKFMFNMMKQIFFSNTGSPGEKKTLLEAITPDRVAFVNMVEPMQQGHPIYQEVMNKVDQKQVQYEASEYDGTEDKRTITVDVFRSKEGSDKPLKRALIYYHGGGCCMHCPVLYSQLCSRYASDNDLVVFLIDYRLAPETPFPGGPFDCYSAVKWLVKNAQEFGVDANMISIGGESAGGNLVLNVSRILAERNEQNLVKLVLCSTPMCSPHE